LALRHRHTFGVDRPLDADGTIAVAEVALRNALHRELSRWSQRRHGHDRWYDAHQTLRLDDHARRDIRNAIDKAGVRSTPAVPAPGKVVAELSFGFWTFLVARKYQTTIWPILRPAFQHHSNPRDRHAVHRQLDDLRFVRNRIAHHEPLLRRDIARDHHRILEVVGWVCPHTAGWLAAISRTGDVLACRPT
jgi:hypothetical protein